MNTHATQGHYRRWLLGGLVLTVALILPWIGVMLLAREQLPGSSEQTPFFFGLAIVATYVGLWIFAIFMSRTRRLMCLRAAGTTFTVVILLAILELPALFKWVHWQLTFRTLAGEGTDYQTAYVLDETLSFRRIPGLQWSGRPASDIEERYGLPRSLKRSITFTYDRWGYRNATEIDQADLVLIGDSYVEGWYVSDEETAAARLADHLNKPVANLGVAGYGTMQALRVLQDDALERKPHVIAWFFFEGNDLYDDQVFENAMVAAPPGPEETKPHPQGLTQTHGWERRSFVKNALRWLRRWSHPVVPNQAPYWGYMPTYDGSLERIYFFNYGAIPWTEYEESRWEKAREAFKNGITIARNHDIDLLLVYVPTKYRVYRDIIEIPPGSPMAHWNVWTGFPERFLDMCTSMSVPCINLTARLQQAVRTGERIYPPTDTHWSPEGHALVATELERLLHSLDQSPPTPDLPDSPSTAH